VIFAVAASLQAASSKRNIVFVLTDDHRFDAMGFMDHPFLETPQLDRLANEGAHVKNAFVTTSLCSPSRASILTGLYAHRHGIVDNNENHVSEDLVFFPQLLQKAGYQTGFFGKWHMGGHNADPQRGFDQWVSFDGQGRYWPDGKGTDWPVTKPIMININGTEVPQKGYITDELTDYALDWLKDVPQDQPFFMYISHKAVHSAFVPADRHIDRYKGKKMPNPKSRNHHENAPLWVQNQRNSWHGVDYAYHKDLNIEYYYQRYCEALLSVDENVGRVLDVLKKRGQLDNTLFVYMGDNGFGFGEHGLIDKRNAYEWSMRVPMLARCPDMIPAGSTVESLVANIDIAPTLLEAAGVSVPGDLDGQSAWQAFQGKKVAARTEFMYEYFWEKNYPHTPTIFALRTDRYKYIRPHGVWDLEELYDLKADPEETYNLISNEEHASIARQMNKRLFEILEETGGMKMPLRADRGNSSNLRHADGSKTADFPAVFLRE